MAPVASEKLEENDKSQSANVESRRTDDKGINKTSSRDHITFSANAAERK